MTIFILLLLFFIRCDDSRIPAWGKKVLDKLDILPEMRMDIDKMRMDIGSMKEEMDADFLVDKIKKFSFSLSPFDGSIVGNGGLVKASLKLAEGLSVEGTFLLTNIHVLLDPATRGCLAEISIISNFEQDSIVLDRSLDDSIDYRIFIPKMVNLSRQDEAFEDNDLLLFKIEKKDLPDGIEDGLEISSSPLKIFEKVKGVSKSRVFTNGKYLEGRVGHSGEVSEILPGGGRAVVDIHGVRGDSGTFLLGRDGKLGGVLHGKLTSAQLSFERRKVESTVDARLEKSAKNWFEYSSLGNSLLKEYIEETNIRRIRVIDASIIHSLTFKEIVIKVCQN